MRPAVHPNTGDMFGRVFPGEPYVLEFEPSEEQTAAVERAAERRGCGDLLPMLLGGHA